MALAAALPRVATGLFRGGLQPFPPAAAVPLLSLRINRQLCDAPAAEELPAEDESWKEAEAEMLRDVEPVVDLVKNILHCGSHGDYRKSRCFFVLRTNGDLEDFSYRKCLRAYIERKYPSHADRFIEKHLVQRRWRRADPEK